MEEADIKDMRFHDLRHTYASHFLMNGGDLYTLKEILGHKDITTTSRYLTITTAHKSKAMEIFEVPENESNILNWRDKALLCKQEKSHICIATEC